MSQVSNLIHQTVVFHQIASCPQTADLLEMLLTLVGDNNNNNNDAFQPGLGVCGASLSSPGRLVLSDLIGAGNRQMVNVRQAGDALDSCQCPADLLEMRI